MVDPLLIINIFIIIVLVRGLYRRVRYRPLGKFYLPGLSLKLLAGILLGLYYIVFFQGGDTLMFNEDATRMAGTVFDKPGEYLRVVLFNDHSTLLWGTLKLADQPRALLTAKILSVFHIFTNGNYWISGFYFSLFAYTGLWSLGDRLATYFPWTRNASIAGFIFFPSVIFWSSGVSKEAISTGLIAWIISIYVPALARGEGVAKRKVIVSLVLLFILWLLKYYYAAALIAILIPTLIVSVLKSISAGISWNFNKQVLYWLSFLVWSVVIASFIHPNLRLTNVMEVVSTNHALYTQMSDPDNLIRFRDFTPTFLGYVKNIPIAVWAGLFQPLPWEAEGYIKLIASLENLIILVFAVFSILNISRINVSNNGILVIGALAYIFLMAVFLAFSTPNLGTFARYKSGFAFLFIYLVLADPVFKRLLKIKRE